MTTPSPEPRWLNEDDGEAWVAFVSMLIWLPTALDDQLQRDSGMSHYEYGILAALSGADAATLRMSELAMFANGSLPRLSRAVARLEGRKWVTRKPDPADGRYTLAVLTDKGRKVLVEAAPGHVEAVNRLVFDVLTTAQARQLGIIARRILKAIDSETDLISRLLPKFGHVSSLWGSGRSSSASNQPQLRLRGRKLARRRQVVPARSWLKHPLAEMIQRYAERCVEALWRSQPPGSGRLGTGSARSWTRVTSVLHPRSPNSGTATGSAGRAVASRARSTAPRGSSSA